MVALVVGLVGVLVLSGGAVGQESGWEIQPEDVTTGHTSWDPHNETVWVMAYGTDAQDVIVTNTSDGGLSWTNHTVSAGNYSNEHVTNRPQNGIDVETVDADTWVVAWLQDGGGNVQGPVVSVTNDAGQTWDSTELEIPLSGTNDPEVAIMSSTDWAVCWMNDVDDKIQLARTTDSGSSWVNVTVRTNPGASAARNCDVVAKSASQLVITGEQPTNDLRSLSSTDGGENWNDNGVLDGNTNGIPGATQAAASGTLGLAWLDSDVLKFSTTSSVWQSGSFAEVVANSSITDAGITTHGDVGLVGLNRVTWVASYVKAVDQTLMVEKTTDGETFVATDTGVVVARGNDCTNTGNFNEATECGTEAKAINGTAYGISAPGGQLWIVNSTAVGEEPLPLDESMSGFQEITEIAVNYAASERVYVRELPSVAGDQFWSFDENLMAITSGAVCDVTFGDPLNEPLGLAVTVDNFVVHSCSFTVSPNEQAVMRTATLQQPQALSALGSIQDIEAENGNYVVVCDDSDVGDTEIAALDISNGNVLWTREPGKITDCAVDFDDGTQRTGITGTAGTRIYSSSGSLVAQAAGVIGRAIEMNQTDVWINSGGNLLIRYRVGGGTLVQQETQAIGPSSLENNLKLSKDGRFILHWTTDQTGIYNSTTLERVGFADFGGVSADMTLENDRLYTANSTVLRAYDASGLGLPAGASVFANTTQDDVPAEDEGSELIDSQAFADAFGVSVGNANLVLGVMLVLFVTASMWVVAESVPLSIFGAGVGVVFAYGMGLFTEWVIVFIFAVIATVGVVMFRG